MALTKCPECGRENVSNTAESCPNCGYNIKKHFERLDQEKQNQENAKIDQWKSRVSIALKKNEHEKIADLITIGNEGYYSGYLQVGLLYFSKGDFDRAYQYYMMAYDLSPENPNILNNIGYLYSQKTFSKFNMELAIEFLTRSDCGTAHNNLAGIYRDKSYGQYADMDKAIAHYHKALEKGYSDNHVLNNLGVLYGDHKKEYSLAASYCYLAAKAGNKQGENNYKIFLSLVQNKDILENGIKTLKSHSDVIPMIIKVKAQTKSQNVLLDNNAPNKKVYSNKLKIGYVVGVMIFTVLALWFVIAELLDGVFVPAVVIPCIILIAIVFSAIYFYHLSDDRPSSEEMIENHKREKYNYYKYTCPMCGSKKVKTIGTLNRGFSIYLFGLASSKIGKQYHCDNCKHKW